MATLEEYKSQAKLAMESADYGAAIRSLTEAISLENDNITLYFTRGLAYFMRKDYDLAIEDLTAVLSVEYQNLDALLTRGNAYFHREQLDEAYHDYSEFINIAGEHPNAPYERRATILTRQGKIADAIADYTQAIAHQENDNGKLYFHRALLKYASRQFEDALNDATYAIENGYPAPETYEARASAYAQLHQWQKALTDYDTALELDKRSASAYYNRGAVHYQMGNLAVAIADFSAALKIDDSDNHTRYVRALVYLDTGDYREARRDLSMVLEADPNNAAAYHKRGIAYTMRDQIDKALDDFEKAVKLAPTMVDYLISLGEIELEIEGYDSAIGYFKRALLHHNNKKTVSYQQALAGLSLAYFLNQDTNSATTYYNQLVDLDLAYGDCDVWQTRFGWHSNLIEAASKMIIWIEAQDI